MTDADYADDLVLLAKTTTHSGFLLQSLEQTAGGIDFNVDANKTEPMCFKRKGAISTQSG